ncbi:hypothetical protein BGY98DRAFT_879951, partial [Russula aff. rugulosa BPL654]
EKGSKWAVQIWRAVRPSWGLILKAACRVYIDVAISRILYGADMWCVSMHIAPEKSKRKGSIHVIRKLIITQSAETLAITGGLRTSPTNALNV